MNINTNTTHITKGLYSKLVQALKLLPNGQERKATHFKEGLQGLQRCILTPRANKPLALVESLADVPELIDLHYPALLGYCSIKEKKKKLYMTADIANVAEKQRVMVSIPTDVLNLLDDHGIKPSDIFTILLKQNFL